MPRERGQWAFYFTSPQSFRIRQLDYFGDFYGILIGWFITKCPNVSTINFNLKKGYFCESLLMMYIYLSAIVLSLYIPDNIYNPHDIFLIHKWSQVL